MNRSQALLYGKLAGEVLDRRRQRRYDPESLELSARLLSLNPEVYTVWNYRCGTASGKNGHHLKTSSLRQV